MHRIDGPGAVDGAFTEGNPTLGVPATVVTSDMMNALQEEIAHVIEAAGDTLDKADNTQLYAAIAALIAAGGGTTIASNKIRREVVAINAAAASTEAGHCENILECSFATAITYTVNPDSTYNAPIGTAIEIAQAGVGKVTVVAGAGVTLKKPASFNAKTMEQEATIVLYKTAANTWRLGGILEAAA